jgi:hypothetical protein
MGVQSAVAVLAHAADAELGSRNAAVVMTEITEHFLIIKSVI